MAGRATGKTEVKGNNYFEHNFGGETFTFFISDEDASVINTDKINPYLDEYGALVEKARDVLNNEYMFGNIDVKALSKRYAFCPFKYQISNVEKMLNRFRGRGVFGDQVGLGKTIEALMTAHAMFESGAIRNALFVVDHKTIPGWLNEILTKFTGIFKVYVVKEALEMISEEVDGKPIIEMVKKLSKNSPKTVEYIEFGSSLSDEDQRLAEVFERLIKRIDEDNNTLKSKKSGFRIYIITERMLAASQRTLARKLREKMRLDSQNVAISDSYKTVISNLVSKINDKKEGNYLDLEGVFKADIGAIGGEVINFEKLIEKIKREGLFKAGRAVYDALKEFSDEFDMKLRNNKLKKDIKIAALKMKIELFQKHLDEISMYSDDSRGALAARDAQLMSDDIIDLMVIDEIHKIYDAKKGKPSKVMVEILSKIQKKFCVLISATPVRTRLDDIFELLYIANPKMFGNKRYDDAKDYFYRTLCRIGGASEYANDGDVDPKNERYPLADMLLVDQAISPEQLKIFLGLVNGFFTRKRIKNVEADMKGIEDKIYSNLEPLKKRIIDSLKENIVRHRAIMYAKEGMSEPFVKCREIACGEWDEWVSCRDMNKLFYESAREALEAEGKSDTVQNLLKMQKDKKRHFFSAIDMTLIEIIGIVDSLILKKSQGELDEEFDTLKNALVGLDGCDFDIYSDKVLAIVGSRLAVVEAYNAFTREGSSLYSSGIKNFVKEFDAVVKSMFDSKQDAQDKLLEFKRTLYSMIDWSRRKKYGMAFVPNTEYEAKLVKDGIGLDMEKYGYNGRLTEHGARAYNIMQSICKLAVYGTVDGATVDGGKFIAPLDMVDAFDSEFDDDFAVSLNYDTVMAYLSNSALIPDTKGMIKIASDHYISDKKFSELCDSSGREVETVSNLSFKDSVNRFVFFDENYKAGVNLQQYKSFVFFQMEDKDHNLLSPADIEQWIGRIHRTGQVKNCRILTVIDHSDKSLTRKASNDRSRVSAPFLVWYYELLSDPNGLDLYGNNTPDIAFIQPIVSDFVRQALRSNENVNYDLKSLDFAQLAKKCYEYDAKNGGTSMTDYIKYCIQLLRAYGFGDSAIDKDPKEIINIIRGALQGRSEIIGSLTGILRGSKSKAKKSK